MMLFLTRFIVSTLIICSISPDSIADSTLEEVDALDRLVLQSRRQIKQIDAELRNSYCRRDDCKNNQLNVGTIRYYWDGGSRRMDKTRSESNYAGSIRDVLIQADERTISWSDKLTRSGGNLSVMMYAGEAAKQANSKNKLPNILMIGFAPMSFDNSIYYNLESYIGNKDRTEVRLNNDAINENIKIIKYLTNKIFYVTYKIDVSKGHNLISLSLDSLVEGKRNLATVESTVALDTASGIWFPVVSHYNQITAGEVDARQDLEIKINSINRPLDPSVFTIPTMGITAGTTITKIPAERSDVSSYFWNGSGIARRDKSGRVISIEQAPTTSSSFIYVLIANGVIFIVIAIGLFWRYSRAQNEG